MACSPQPQSGQNWASAWYCEMVSWLSLGSSISMVEYHAACQRPQRGHHFFLALPHAGHYSLSGEITPHDTHLSNTMTDWTPRDP